MENTSLIGQRILRFLNEKNRYRLTRKAKFEHVVFRGLKCEPLHDDDDDDDDAESMHP